MLELGNKIRYFADEKQFPLFFTDALIQTVEHLDTALQQHIEHISIYPDATLKTNGLPNGISCAFDRKESLLLPFILRDPGCGFLMFKLTWQEKPPMQWQQMMGDLLASLSEQPEFKAIKNDMLYQIGMREICQQGLLAVAGNEDIEKFIHSSFPVRQDVKLTPAEIQLFQEDFMNFTNTIEIRKITHVQMPEMLSNYDVSPETPIGFIHSGSLVFPKLLGEKFVYRICEYGHQNRLFSLADIDKGIVGVRLNSPLGREYENWLHIATNYALASRYATYLAVQKILTAHFPCKIDLINDNMHAGLFEKTTASTVMSYSTRGVQNIFPYTKKCKSHGLTLLAGHRETTAALITGAKQAAHYDNLIAHGTGYHVEQNFNYKDKFSEQESSEILLDAQNTYYNSTPEYETCIPYTYNLYNSLNYFENIQLTNTVALLKPVINIHSDWLKSDGV